MYEGTHSSMGVDDKYAPALSETLCFETVLTRLAFGKYSSPMNLNSEFSMMSLTSSTRLRRLCDEVELEGDDLRRFLRRDFSLDLDLDLALGEALWYSLRR